jgi:hypothetical protein
MRANSSSLLSSIDYRRTVQPSSPAFPLPKSAWRSVGSSFGMIPFPLNVVGRLRLLGVAGATATDGWSTHLPLAEQRGRLSHLRPTDGRFL